MTGSNLSSAVAENVLDRKIPESRIWVGLVVVLGLVVVGLNALLFLFVQSQQREMEARETQVQRRLVTIEAQEAHRAAIQPAIDNLEYRKAAAEKVAEEAEKAARDATQQRADRDRALHDFQATTTELAKQNAELESSKSRIAGLKLEETEARKNLDRRSDELKLIDKQKADKEAAIAALESQRNDLASKADADRKAAGDATKLKDSAFRDWQEKSKDLASIQAQLQGSIAQRNTINVDQAAAQKANAVRVEAENALSKAQGELQVVQNQLAATRADLAQLEKRRNGVASDEAEASRAAVARLESEKTLSKAQGDLSATLRQLSSAQAEMAKIEQLRSSAAIDTAAAQQADRARSEAETELAKKQAELESIKREIAEQTGRRVALLQDISRINTESNLKNAPQSFPETKPGPGPGPGPDPIPATPNSTNN